MKIYLAVASVLTGTLLAGSPVLADDDEPPLYVAADGADRGNCASDAAPCRTLGYALRRVGKHGRIEVREGSYRLADSADLIYLLSDAIDVQGKAVDGKQPSLLGVPKELAEPLRRKGFRVIADGKGLSSEAVQMQLGLQSNTAATPCIGGSAAGFPCAGVDLLSHVADRAAGARGADIWGFMDLNTHREYALVSYSTGTAVYDVSNPELPREVGFVAGQTTTWRDIKVHQSWDSAAQRWKSYAYITADNAFDGLFIIDLSELPHRVARISYPSDFSEAHNVFLSDTDFATGLSASGEPPMLILAGSNRSDGRFRAYSLADPRNPAFVGAPATPAGQAGNDRLYMHDAAAMLVSDARKDTQCVNAGNRQQCKVLFDFNESTVDIWDITDPASPARLSQLPYSGATYTHSGWPTEDQQYLFIQDELDERDRGLATTLRIVDISDLTAPAHVATWTGSTNAIDHNGFVRGNRYYMSNYARGLTVLDISDPTNPSEAGRFDTYPISDQVGFPGNWGAYPFFPSGNIGLSDIDSGFYLVADKTLAVAEGSLAFTAESFGNDETQTLNLAVERQGDTSGAVSVRWEVLAASADYDDVVSRNGVLGWADGVGGEQNIALELNNDGAPEGLERVLVKLTAPTGGATLGAPAIASAYLSDPGDTTSIGFAEDVVEIPERGFGTAVAVVQRSGSASGPAAVDFSVGGGDASQSGDYSGPMSGTLNWDAGDATPKWIEFDIVDDGSAEDEEFFEVSLNNPSGGALAANTVLRVNILDGTGSNAAPNAVAGASQTVAAGAEVQLDGRASNDPDGDDLGYAWTQTVGPAVTLLDANAEVASFTAPSVGSDTLLRFELEVLDANGLADSSTASVTVRASGSGGAGSGGGSASTWLLGVLTLLLLLSRRGEPSRWSGRDPVPSI